MFHNPWWSRLHPGKGAIPESLPLPLNVQRCADLSCVASSASCSAGVRQFRRAEELSGFELVLLVPIGSMGRTVYLPTNLP